MHYPTWRSPDRIPLSGQFVTLMPLVPARDVAGLYAVSHGTAEKEAVWNYLFYGPFRSSMTMKAWLENDMVSKDNILTWTVFENANETQVGIVALQRSHPNMAVRKSVTSGFRRCSQKPSQYRITILLLCHLFDQHHYRRVEWKCDAFNHASRTAAMRMGFLHEGRFRQHMIIKGKNRDTDWFAMTDKEWPRCKTNFEKWLYSGEKLSLMELNNG
ncbi:MAG: GNAT family N-acetyltransferase [Leptolyngbyaceae cyanobacterium SM1_3_5]|nr:GNAT family N-acetyltransferase [Leptolyngbyaceae cyanobacterium SM1_3_5]